MIQSDFVDSGCLLFFNEAMESKSRQSKSMFSEKLAY